MNLTQWQELNLQQPQVRDLYWAVNSPGLMPHPALLDWRDDSPWFADWIKQLDAKPDLLLQFLAKSPQNRLGRYFEQLWQFYLQQHRGFELLAANRQIHGQDGVTQGELDILVRHIESDAIWHLELAAKFYCRVLPGHEFQPEHLWVGAKLNDRWDNKLHQLLTQQLPLAQTPLAQQALAAEQLLPMRSFAIVKGQLFVPELCAAGWLPQADLSQLPEERCYLPLAPKEWLAPRQASDAWLSKAELLEYFAQSRPSMQLAVWHPERQEQSGRLFVMAECWHAQALALAGVGHG